MPTFSKPQINDQPVSFRILGGQTCFGTGSEKCERGTRVEVVGGTEQSPVCMVTHPRGCWNQGRQSSRDSKVTWDTDVQVRDIQMNMNPCLHLEILSPRDCGAGGQGRGPAGLHLNQPYKWCSFRDLQMEQLIKQSSGSVPGIYHHKDPPKPLIFTWLAWLRDEDSITTSSTRVLPAS